jgi:hypothetical protein
MASSDGFESADQLDKTGQSIMRLLQKASETVDQNSRHVLDTAQKLAHQLRAAQDRIADLEANSQPPTISQNAPSNGSTRSVRKSKISFRRAGVSRGDDFVKHAHRRLACLALNHDAGAFGRPFCSPETLRCPGRRILLLPIGPGACRGLVGSGDGIGITRVICVNVDPRHEQPIKPSAPT